MSFTRSPSFSKPPSFTEPSSFTRPPSFIGNMNTSNCDQHVDPSINQQIPKDLDTIPLQDIIQATNNFAEENIIEEASHRTVYKGELSEKKLAFVLVEENDYIKINFRDVVMFSSLLEILGSVPHQV
ncbi:hypothetical protein Tco_1041759 [Tanacetum coccineum]|uniref:Uncharacterized protein n=1 Tax=Tanacetum coccineum TaxID=301880 RepID=A0ABQ5GIM6_9ASTR